MSNGMKGTNRSIRLSAPAKVNLHLEVLRRRHDGFHDIETVLQAVAVYDHLQVTVGDVTSGGVPSIQILVKPHGRVPENETNLCWRAAAVFCRHTGLAAEIQIELDKQVPVGAGLGGGSSDAMAVLVACDRLFATNLGPEGLMALASEIGSDVPFFLHGGTQLGRGRGTQLTLLPHLRKTLFLVLKPKFAIHTGGTYEDLKMGLTVRTPAANLQVIKSLLARFPDRQWFGYNRLEEVVLPAHPELSRMLLRFREIAPVAMLSGSGSAIFGVVQSREACEELIQEFRSTLEFARFVEPLDRGVQLLRG